MNRNKKTTGWVVFDRVILLKMIGAARFELATPYTPWPIRNRNLLDPSPGTNFADNLPSHRYMQGVG